MRADVPAHLARFARVLQEGGGEARLLASGEEVADAVASAAGEQGSARILYDPFSLAEELGLASLLGRRGVELVPVEDAGDEARRLPVGLTGASLAVADTGTVVLGGRPGGWGLAAALPWVHVVVIRAADVVADLEGAFGRFARWIEEGRDEWVWITGPSRTADMGQVLVHGAHGPNRLYALVLHPDPLGGGACAAAGAAPAGPSPSGP